MARLRIGLTGGIASGKSTVAKILADLGAVIIDADQLAREVVEPGTEGLTKIIERFGDRVITDGRLDRAELGKIIFADPEARTDLEAIIHPAVRRRAAELQAAADSDAVVVQMIPLLVETGQAGSFDRLLVVDVPPELQRQRLIARNGLTEAEADARIAAQASRTDRLAAADVVIDNSDPDLERLRQRVIEIFRRLQPEGTHDGPPARNP
ncbi:MAG TPA: dephospho-CoA kinase [Microlunatus sp.]